MEIYRTCDSCGESHHVCVPYDLLGQRYHICLKCAMKFENNQEERDEFEKRLSESASADAVIHDITEYCRKKAKEREAYTHDHIADAFIRKQVFGYWLDRRSKEDCWARLLIDHLEWKIDHKDKIKDASMEEIAELQTQDSLPSWAKTAIL